MTAANTTPAPATMLDTHHYDAVIGVVDAVRRALEKCRHYESFSARVVPVVRAELSEGYTVALLRDGDRVGLTIWGSLMMRKSIELAWSSRVPWVEGLEEALTRADSRDHEQRLVDENGLIELFERLNRTVVAAREQAAEAIRRLPVPPSATVRRLPAYWEHPSKQLAERFPALFK